MAKDNLVEQLGAKIEEARKKLMDKTHKHNVGGLDGFKAMLKKRQPAEDYDAQ